jgi:hypothetical protein
MNSFFILKSIIFIFRRRLQEGFHFAISHNNIHNLILEVKMNVYI